MKRFTLTVLCAALCSSFAFANENTVTDSTVEDTTEKTSQETSKKSKKPVQYNEKGEIIKKVPEEELVDELFREIERL